MRRISNAYLFKRGNTFYFRRVIPKAMHRRAGRSEIWLSLKTRDPALAWLRCLAASYAFEEVLTALTGKPYISDGALKAKLMVHFEQRLSQLQDSAYLLAQQDAAAIDGALFAASSMYDNCQVELTASYFSQRTIISARSICKDNGCEFDELSPVQQQTLCQLVVRAEMELCRKFPKLVQGFEDGSNPDPAFLQSISIAPATAKDDSVIGAAGKPIEKVVSDYCSIKSKFAWEPKTADENERILGFLVDVLGAGTPITSVSAEMVREFRDIFIDLPKGFATKAEFGGQSLKWIATHSKGQNLYSAGTLKKYLMWVKAFFAWCVDEGYINVHPAPNIKIAKQHSHLTARVPFSSDQLATLFSSPQYTGHHSYARRSEPGNLLVRDAKFWIPLVALFTGMRLGEIVQLEVGDLRQEGEVRYFNLNDSGQKKLKTKSSSRKIPIHKVLVNIGLLELVGKAKQLDPKSRIFAEVKPSESGSFSHNFSKYFARYLKNTGLKTPKLAFHSLRHNFADALRVAGVEDSHMKALLGHSDNSVTASYGYGLCNQLQILDNDIQSIKYSFDFNALMDPNSVSSF